MTSEGVCAKSLQVTVQAKSCGIFSIKCPPPRVYFKLGMLDLAFVGISSLFVIICFS